MLKYYKSKHLILFILILFFGILLRTYNLSSIPSSLFRDEVSIGYNAFSILTTLHDEHGIFLPISFQAIGDMKLPVYIYSTVPFIKMFGLQDFVPRIPSAIAGILSIVIMYFLSLSLFKNKWISILAMLFLTISPWHVFASRIAYEPTLALFFIMIGMFLFFDSKKKPYYLIASAISFSITFFTYHGDQIFTPLLILGIIFLGKEIWVNNKKVALISILIVIFLGGIALKTTLLQSDVVKISGLGFWSDKSYIYSAIERKRNEHLQFKDNILVKIWHNKITAYPFKLGENYLKAFSTQFLFEKGDANPWQNMEEMGYFYLIDSIFICIGILVMFRKRESSFKYIVLWLLISPIPGSITKDAPGGSRTLTLVVPLIMTISYGVYESIVYLMKQKKIIKLIGIGFITLSYLFSFLVFIEFYFIHFPINRAIFFGYGFKQEALIAKKSSAPKVIIKGIYEYNYPYFLYYLDYPADKFRKEVIYAPLTSDNFLPVKSFGKYFFVSKINWEKICDTGKALVFTDYNELPKGIKADGIIDLPLGSPRFAYVTTNDIICNKIKKGLLLQR